VGDNFAAAGSPSTASYYYGLANLILGESCSGVLKGDGRFSS
jgi:hypothetical protein